MFVVSTKCGIIHGARSSTRVPVGLGVKFLRFTCPQEDGSDSLGTEQVFIEHCEYIIEHAHIRKCSGFKPQF
jgi:hypothetical protein